MRWLSLSLLMILAITVVLACSKDTPTPTPAPTATAIPRLTTTATPVILVPTATATSRSTATATPRPTATATSRSTATPVPSTTAIPDTTAPMVSSTVPANAATGVALNASVSAIFSEAMNPLTITTASFTLKQGATPVTGAVTYTGVTAVFTSASNLAAGTTYTATVTTGAKDLAGNALATNKVWTFTTGTALAANPTAPVLGEAGRFVLLASQAITTTVGSAVSNGGIGIIDRARTFISGFTPGAGPGTLVELTNGLSYAPDDVTPFTFPAPYASSVAFITQVRTDLGIAYTFLAADPNPGAPTQVLPIELGELTLTRGVYKTAFNVTIQTGDLTLDAQGNPNSVWIFTIDGTLTTGAPGGNIVLSNGAQAKNVYGGRPA